MRQLRSTRLALGTRGEDFSAHEVVSSDVDDLPQANRTSGYSMDRMLPQTRTTGILNFTTNRHPFSPIARAVNTPALRGRYLGLLCLTILLDIIFCSIWGEKITTQTWRLFNKDSQQAKFCKAIAVLSWRNELLMQVPLVADTLCPDPMHEQLI